MNRPECLGSRSPAGSKGPDKAIRVKGQRVRALRRYLSEHTKTDAADAYVLGAIPWFGGVPVDPVYVPNADRHALQRLTRQRERLEDEVSTISVG